MTNFMSGFCCGGDREEVKTQEMLFLEGPDKRCRKWAEHEDYILIESLSRSLP